MNKEQKAVVVRFLEIVKDKVVQEQLMMERNGFVIDNLDDQWQKLAFTLYTDIMALSTEAENILEYLREG